MNEKPFAGVLFASDYDHTLSAPDGTVPEANRAGIRRFIDAGGRFCIASGRSVRLLSSRLELVPVNAPCLCFNGSACYDYQAHRLLWEQPMGFDAQRLIDAAVAFDPGIEAEVQTAEGHFMRGQPDQRAYFLQTQGVVPHFGELPPQPWMKLVFCVPPERTAAEAILIERPDELPPQTAQRVQRLWDFLLREAGDSCYVTRSLPRVLEVGPKGCDKGAAARRLMAALGCDRLVCAGDAPNDLELLQSADLAFVPRDCDPTIAALDCVHFAAASADGAVGDAIEQLFSGKIAFPDRK